MLSFLYFSFLFTAISYFYETCFWTYLKTYLNLIWTCLGPFLALLMNISEYIRTSLWRHLSILFLYFLWHSYGPSLELLWTSLWRLFGSYLDYLYHFKRILGHIIRYLLDHIWTYFCPFALLWRLFYHILGQI